MVSLYVQAVHSSLVLGVVEEPQVTQGLIPELELEDTLELEEELDDVEDMLEGVLKLDSELKLDEEELEVEDVDEGVDSDDTL